MAKAKKGFASFELLFLIMLVSDILFVFLFAYHQAQNFTASKTERFGIGFVAVFLAIAVLFVMEKISALTYKCFWPNRFRKIDFESIYRINAILAVYFISIAYFIIAWLVALLKSATT